MCIILNQHLMLDSCMASLRTTFTMDEELAQQAHQLGINISAAARMESPRRFVPHACVRP